MILLCRLLTKIRNQPIARRVAHAATVNTIYRVLAIVMNREEARKLFSEDLVSNLSTILELVEDPWPEIDIRQRSALTQSAFRVL